jgi:hypothetical protein
MAKKAALPVNIDLYRPDAENTKGPAIKLTLRIDGSPVQAKMGNIESPLKNYKHPYLLLYFSFYDC